MVAAEWTPELRAQAQAQGWDLFDANGILRLEAVVECQRFTDDSAAWEHVRRAALLGDPPAITALFVLARENPAEAIQVMADRGVFAGRALSDRTEQMLQEHMDAQGEEANDEMLEALGLLIERLGMSDFTDYYLGCFFSGHVITHPVGGGKTSTRLDLPGQTNLLDQIQEDEDAD